MLNVKCHKHFYKMFSSTLSQMYNVRENVINTDLHLQLLGLFSDYYKVRWKFFIHIM